MPLFLDIHPEDRTLTVAEGTRQANIRVRLRGEFSLGVDAVRVWYVVAPVSHVLGAAVLGATSGDWTPPASATTSIILRQLQQALVAVGTIVFTKPGELTVSIPITDDNIMEFGERFTVTVDMKPPLRESVLNSAPPPVPESRVASILIEDNDSVVRFATETPAVVVEGATLRVRVLAKRGNPNLAPTVQCSLAEGTAVAPSDFELLAPGGVYHTDPVDLVFMPGGPSGETHVDVRTRVVGGGDPTAPKTLTLKLQNPGGGAQLDPRGRWTKMDVEIVESDVVLLRVMRPALVPPPGSYAPGTPVEFSVERLGNMEGSASAEVWVSAGCAGVAGGVRGELLIDGVPVAGMPFRLEFGPGERRRKLQLRSEPENRTLSGVRGLRAYLQGPVSSMPGITAYVGATDVCVPYHFT